jgi:hypothetical protein
VITENQSLVVMVVMMIVDGGCDDQYMNGDGNVDSVLMMIS